MVRLVKSTVFEGHKLLTVDELTIGVVGNGFIVTVEVAEFSAYVDVAATEFVIV